MTPEPVGSLAEEAAKLIAVVQGWAADHTAPADSGAREGAPADAEEGVRDGRSDHGSDGTGESGEEAGPGVSEGGRSPHAEHDPALECRWCPVCQLIRAARATTPEVRDHLTNAAMSLALAFKGLMDGVDDPSDRRSQPVEKIDLDLGMSE